MKSGKTLENGSNGLDISKRQRELLTAFGHSVISHSVISRSVYCWIQSGGGQSYKTKGAELYLLTQSHYTNHQAMMCHIEKVTPWVVPDVSHREAYSMGGPWCVT